jgi:hypothetical protein
MDRKLFYKDSNSLHRCQGFPNGTSTVYRQQVAKYHHELENLRGGKTIDVNGSIQKNT